MNALLILAASIAAATVTPSPINSSNATAPRRLARVCAIAHNIDHVGQDFSNARASSSDQCCDLCSGIYGCRSWTWVNYEGGTCYFKKRSPTDWLVSIGAESCDMDKSVISTPAFWDCDMPGNDLYSESNADPQYCSVFCALQPSCKAVTWANSVCYYKYESRKCVFKANAKTFIPYNHFVTSTDEQQ